MSLQTTLDVSEIITTTLTSPAATTITTDVTYTITTSVAANASTTFTLDTSAGVLQTSLSGTTLPANISTSVNTLATVVSNTSSLLQTTTSAVGAFVSGTLPSAIEVTDYFVLERNGVMYRTPYQDIAAGADMPAYTKRVDTISDELLYKGEAVPGTGDSSPLWRVSRVEIVSDDVTEKYANGSAEFIHVWSDRATLTYT